MRREKNPHERGKNPRQNMAYDTVEALGHSCVLLQCGRYRSPDAYQRSYLLCDR